MRSRVISKKAAAFGAAAVLGIGGGAAGVAYAYPSGVPFTVSASATAPDASGNSTVTFTLGNNDPRCATRVTVGGQTIVLPAGTATGTTVVTNATGRQRVRARTIDCSLQESARVDFVVPDARITGEETQAEVRDRVRFNLTGLEPGTMVTVAAVSGGASYSATDTVDRRGEAKVRFRFLVAGTYAVTATVNGSVVATTSIQITN